MRRHALSFASAFIFQSLFAPYSVADNFFHVIRYVCDTENNILTINYYGIYNDQPYYSDEYGKYNPWDMVITDGYSRITGTKSVQKICKLGEYEYKVIIEPEIFNSNVLGECGADISGAATIYRGDKMILRRTAFIKFCTSNDPVITEFRVEKGNDNIVVITMDKKSFFKE